MRSFSLAPCLLVSTSLLFACAPSAIEDAETLADAVKVAPAKRDEAVAAAQVWSAEEFAKLPSKDVARGPAFANAPQPGEEIVCKFVEPTEKDELGGKTEKFKCGPCEVTPEEQAAGKKPCTVKSTLKVKYSGIGRPASTDPATMQRFAAEDAKKNGEVFAEAIGTRLLWSLGFYADGIYPVKVVCYGCPEKPWDTYTSFPSAGGGARADRRFQFGAVEIKLAGDKLEAEKDQGFDWGRDIALIDPKKGGATQEQLDAWKLVASLMTHGDNKAANQRVFCEPGALAQDGTCARPRAMIQDVGATFGSEGSFFGIGFKKAELKAWRGERVWKDLSRCQANLTSRNPLHDPVVSEAGRAFLAKLLDPAVLTDEKLTAIFTTARVAERGEKIEGEDGRERLATVADWVAAFDEKRAELARPCP